MPEGLDLLTDFSIIMVTAGVVIVLFRRLHLPVVLGYLVAGLIVGPYTPPFPLVRDAETIRQLADFGIILLLFSLGLDFNIHKLRQVGIVATIAGSMEIIFTLFLGYQVGRLLGWSVTDSLFMAAALSISSTAIVVKLLTDMGKTNLLSSQITFGILIIEDFVAVLLMALLSGLATTETMDWPGAGALLVKLLVLAAAALALGRVIAPRVLDMVARVHSREALVVASLALCFSMALLSNALGLSVAAGAFLMGAIISESRHMEEIGRLLTPIRDMFGALFFVAMGMLIDVSALGQYWGPALLLTVFAILGKIVFASLGTYISGYDGRTSLRVGMALTQRGEFSLIIAKIGRDARVTAPFVYPLVAGVCLVTATVSPFLLSWADGLAERVERLAPRRVREYVNYVGTLFHTVRRSAARHSPLSKTLQERVSLIAINVLIMGVFLLSGSLVLDFADSLAAMLRLPFGIVRASIGIITLILSLPSALVIWRSLGVMWNAILETTPVGRSNTGLLGRDIVRHVLRNTMLIIPLLLLGIISLPLIVRLVGLGLPYFLGLPGLVVAAVVYLLWSSLREVHRRLEGLYRQGLLGEKPEEPPPPHPPGQ